MPLTRARQDLKTLSEYHAQDYQGLREAFVEINDRFVAVRLRTLDQDVSLADAECVAYSVQGSEARVFFHPRLSTDHTHWGAYFELEATQDGNTVADNVKAALTALEYTLTKERFNV